MNKFIVAAAVLASIPVCSNSGAFAQDKPAPSTGMVVRSADNPGDQQMALIHRQIDSVKKQAIAANVTLTDTEATKFWPVYDQYSTDLKKITDTKMNLIPKARVQATCIKEDCLDLLK